MNDNGDIKPDSEYYLAMATEASDGKRVKIDGYDDRIIGTSEREDDCTVLCYSFALMLEKYLRETEVELDEDGYELAQASSDLWEITGARQNTFGAYSPIVVYDV